MKNLHAWIAAVFLLWSAHGGLAQEKSSQSVSDQAQAKFQHVQRLEEIGAEMPATPPRAILRFPGETIDQWHGYVRHKFTVDACPAWVVEPEQALPGKPWSWCMEFPDAFTDRCAAPQLLAAGFHHVYIDVGNTFGSPGALRHLDAFYEVLTRAGLAKRCTLIGISRGGLYAYRWAAEHPKRVKVIYGDAPVCDFKSWPGGKGNGGGSTNDWAALLKCYGFKDEAEALAFPGNPIDCLKPLARAGIALIHVVGDADDVVPVAENTAIVEERYRKLGGEIQVIHKPGVGHHPHGLEDPAPVVNWVKRHTLKSAAEVSICELPPTDINVLDGLSPYNWVVHAKSISASVNSASLVVGFKATRQVSVRVDPDLFTNVVPARFPIIAWSVNGGAVQSHQLAPKEKSILLASGVKNPVVDLCIKGMSPFEDRWSGGVPVNSVKIDGFVVDKGGSTRKVALPGKVWLNIGDSIMSGDCAVYAPGQGRPPDDCWASSDDGRASYGYLLAQHYGFREARIAYGGYDWGGGMANVPSVSTLIDQRTATVGRLNGAALGPNPAVVLINLGENGAPADRDVVEALVKLRSRVGQDTKNKGGKRNESPADGVEVTNPTEAQDPISSTLDLDTKGTPGFGAAVIAHPTNVQARLMTIRPKILAWSEKRSGSLQYRKSSLLTCGEGRTQPSCRCSKGCLHRDLLGRACDGYRVPEEPGLHQLSREIPQ